MLRSSYRTFLQTTPLWDNLDFWQIKRHQFASFQENKSAPVPSTIDRSSCHLLYVFTNILRPGTYSDSSHAGEDSNSSDSDYGRTASALWLLPSHGATPQWRPFGHIICCEALSYASLRQITLKPCSSLQLRASSRVHSQCTQPSSFIKGSVHSNMPATLDYTSSVGKNSYEIVKLQN